MKYIFLFFLRTFSFLINKTYSTLRIEKVFYYPLDKQHIQNPYPTFKILNTSKPLYRSAFGFWMVSKHKHVQKILKDPRFGQDYSNRMRARYGDAALEEPYIKMISQWMPMLNQPDHTRIRKIANTSFSPRIVKKMHADVEEIIDDLLNRIEEKGEFDVIQDYAKPLPVFVICKILGIPKQDYNWFLNESQLPARLFDPTLMKRQEKNFINRCVEELNEYFEKFIELKQRSPKEDLGTNMVKAYTDGTWEKDELIATFEVLYAGGHDTTMNAIANGVYSLFNNPSQLELFKQQPELAASAAQEVFRYESSFQLASRIALEDIEFNGRLFNKGDLIIMSLAAANRDPAVFDNPDQFDIQREPNKHLAFGAGIHYCIGAMLSKIETELALKKLIQRFPDLNVHDIENVQWRHMATLRGLEKLTASIK